AWAIKKVARVLDEDAHESTLRDLEAAVVQAAHGAMKLQLTLQPGWREGTLANGLRIFQQNDPQSTWIMPVSLPATEECAPEESTSPDLVEPSRAASSTRQN
ncbi:unnamed protein product, partial [Symbiodinium pilosum]